MYKLFELILQDKPKDDVKFFNDLLLICTDVTSLPKINNRHPILVWADYSANDIEKIQERKDLATCVDCICWVPRYKFIIVLLFPYLRIKFDEADVAEF